MLFDFNRTIEDLAAIADRRRTRKLTMLNNLSRLAANLGMSSARPKDKEPQEGVTSLQTAAAAVNSAATRLSLSIVMPTFNRSAVLDRIVRATHKVSAGFDLEWVVVNDGSSDDTADVLRRLESEIPNFRYVNRANRGPGLARNEGVALARNEIILFMGDDILPTNEDFLRPHAELHAVLRSKKVAVLGKVSWPGNDKFAVTSVMRHIQGRGGEQFGYADFTAYTFLDWRFFYTCNVSIRRDVVDDWSSEGFSPDFPVASFEDAEFAYRLQKKFGSFEIFYCPSSHGHHLHSYGVKAFVRRQMLAGSMAHVITFKHPELGSVISLNDIYAAMQKPIDGGADDLTAEYLCAIEGLKSWAAILEGENRLGNEAWHEDLLYVVFDIAFLQGYITAACQGRTNFSEAYRRVLQRANLRLRRIMDAEFQGSAEFQRRVLIPL